MKRVGLGISVVSLLLITVLLAGGVTTTATGATTGGETAPQQPTPTANNTTVQHERPSTVSQPGDTQRVRDWLEERLGGRLEASALDISQGQYETADAYLGPEYESRLDQYIDVEGETNAGTGDTYQETRDEQAAYADAAQSYQETYDSYQDAQQRGNTTASREAARELEAISTRIIRLNESLQSNYETLGNRTGRNMATSQGAISNTTRTISAQQDAVRTETLVETSLTVDTNGSSAGFTDPMAITGDIGTADGTTVANEPVEILVANQTYQTRTDSEGRFTVVYRPISTPVTAANVSIRYVPDPASPYLGSATTTPVDIEQVTPTLEVTSESQTVGYDDPVETGVTVTVDGRQVPDVPVVSRLGSRTATGETDDDGQVTLGQRLPADVPAGQQSRQVTHNRSGVAIGPTSTTAPLTVTTTDTEIVVTATGEASAVTVQGQLQTVDGVGVSAQPVRITVAGQGRTVDTDSSGRFRVTVTNVSGGSGPNISTVPVTVQFDGTGTNLDGTQTETTVELASAAAGSNGGLAGFSGVGDTDNTLLLPIAGVVLAVLVIAGAVLWARRPTGGAGGTPSTTSQRSSTTPEPSETTPQYLDSARSALTAGNYDLAVTAAYAAVRQRLEEENELPESLTHREFLAAYRAEHDSALVQPFAALVDAYERATFQASADAGIAETAIEMATSMLSRETEPTADES